MERGGQRNEALVEAISLGFPRPKSMLKQQPEPIELNVFLTKIYLYVHV